MQCYIVSASLYFSGLAENTAFERDRGLTEQSMKAVIDRYHLAGTSVLSIGCGSGYEEFWFWESGCSLTLVDLDQHAAIEPYLKTIPSPASPEDTLTFYVGLAQELPRGAGQFDVCYLSSFTPDEFHRRDVQLRQPLNVAIRALRGVSRFVKFLPHLPYRWPSDTAPISDLVIDAVTQYVRDGGLILSQSYYYGVDVLANPRFVSQLCMQLSSHGFCLEDLHCQTQRPDISLLAARRGTHQEPRSGALPKFCGRFEQFGPAHRIM